MVKDKIVKLLDSGLIYPISDSSWFIPIHVVPKKGGMTVVLNDNNECIDYRKLNDATRKDHFPFPFIDQMILARCIEVDKAKIDVIAILPYPINVKGVRSFLGHLFLGQRIDGKFKPIYYASKTLNNAQEHYTATEKELLAVVFSFDKFRLYLVLSKTVVYTDHSTLKYLFRAENLAADHLSRLENPDLGTFTEDEITDEFPDEHLMILKAELNDDEPWLCPYNVMRRCVAGSEILEILAHCHFGPTRGHHSASITGRKVYEFGLFWPSIFKDAKDYVMRCDACQRSGNISSRSEMPQNNI
ncbi:reverse transcriptase domain-containing protein [Tanacetum coccineum]